VLRSATGYRALAPPPTAGAQADHDLRVIAEVELAGALRLSELAGRLAGRWFGSLRWVGVIDRPDERLLAWAPRAGTGLVLLSTRRGQLRVLVPRRLAEVDAGEAEDAAFELLVHAVEALRTPVDRGHDATALLQGFNRVEGPPALDN
jgi:hypothetical protein